MEVVKKIGAQLADFYGALTPGKKISLIGITVSIFVAFGVLFVIGTKDTYQPLMTNLNPEDSGAIMRFLRNKNIPFSVGENSQTIMVPPDKVYDLRLELSTVGLPETSNVGYEIFDKQTFGVTSAVQKINEKRALEGELARTITSMKQVEKARIHLNLPNKSVFLEEQKKPSASLVIQFKKGMELDKKQIAGIQHLIAKSIDGMSSEDVVIVDAFGKKLSQNSESASGALTNEMLDYRERIEREYERRIEELLGKVVGEGRVVVKVNAEVDFQQVAETSISYDPNGSAVYNQTTFDDNLSGSRPVAGGNAGAASQLPDNAQANTSPNNQVTQEIKKTRGVVNYKVPETTKQVTKPVGKINKVSVAVLINGKSVETKNEKGEVVPTIQKWSDAELKQFEQLVSNALGLQLTAQDDGRVDSLKVENMSFYTEDIAETERQIAAADRKRFIAMAIQYAVIGLVISMFFLLVVRPFIRWVTENTTENISDFLPKTIAELETAQESNGMNLMEEGIPSLDKVDPLKAENEFLIKRINELVNENTDKAAQIVHEWINDKRQAANKKKAAAGSEAEAG